MIRQALCGMCLRLGLPLVVCMTAYLYGGVLAEVGFVYYIISFYFVTWAVEIMWLVRSAPAPVQQVRGGLGYGHGEQLGTWSDDRRRSRTAESNAEVAALG